MSENNVKTLQIVMIFHIFSVLEAIASIVYMHTNTSELRFLKQLFHTKLKFSSICVLTGPTKVVGTSFIETYIPATIVGTPVPTIIVGTTVMASVVVSTRLVGTAVPASVVETTAVAGVVPTRFVGTAVPTIIVLTAYYWKSCVVVNHSTNSIPG